MFKSINKKILHLVVISVFFANVFLTGFVLAQESDTGKSVLDGFAQTGKEAGFRQGDKGIAPRTEFAQAFSKYATGFATLFGAFFVIIIIYSGWLWMTAQGNEEKVSKAKARILAGFIGLVFIIAARIIAEIAIYVLGKTVITS